MPTVSLTRRIGAVAAGAALAGGAALTAAPAQAAPVAAPTAVTTDASTSALYYGAISVNRATGAAYQANNLRSQKAAINAAQAKCKKGKHGQYCVNAVWVRSGCAAVAIRYDAKKRPVYLGGGYARTKAGAQKAAIARAGKGSKVVQWLCTRR